MTTPDSIELPELPEGQAWVKLGDRDIIVRRPADEETFVLLQVQEMIEGMDASDISEGVLGAQLFGRTLQQLIVRPDDRRWALFALARRELGLAQFFDLAVSVFAAFQLDLEGDDDETPVTPTKRAVAKKAGRTRSSR